MATRLLENNRSMMHTSPPSDCREWRGKEREGEGERRKGGERGGGGRGREGGREEERHKEGQFLQKDELTGHTPDAGHLMNCLPANP